MRAFKKIELDPKHVEWCNKSHPNNFRLYGFEKLQEALEEKEYWTRQFIRRPALYHTWHDACQQFDNLAKQILLGGGE